MEKTRVNKGEKYWYIIFYYGGIKIVDAIEYLDAGSYCLFRIGNYFHSKEEAETMVRKLQAVLEGANVIKMPNNEELKNEEDRINPYIDNLQSSRYVDGFFDAVKYFKSKIVK